MKQSKADGNSSEWSRSDRKLGAPQSDRSVAVIGGIHGFDYRPHGCPDKGYNPEPSGSIGTARAVEEVDGRKDPDEGPDPDCIW